MYLNLGINASRIRSGGAVAYLVGILQEITPMDFGIKKIHIWINDTLLDALPEQSWLVKHSPPQLKRSIVHQLWWERFSLPRELDKERCSVLLNVSASSVCRFHPAVTVSQDMLSYEAGEINRFGFGKDRLRLIALRYVQNTALSSADGAVFLTHYAGKVIQQYCGELSNVEYIPHGVGDLFRSVNRELPWPENEQCPIHCLYVSNTLPYKHQWHVVKAIELLRRKDFNLQLELLGDGYGRAQKRLEAQLCKSDPHGEFIFQHKFVSNNVVPQFLAKAHLFIFASSCENMPVTLIEAMAAGLPIACSNRGPMPEVLQDGGVYFDPENPGSITDALMELITNPDKRMFLGMRAKELAQQYSWKRCAAETFAFIEKTNKQYRLKCC